MRFRKFHIALMFAAVLSVSHAGLAHAATHKVLESGTYVLSETAEGTKTCTDKDGKALTGWVSDAEGNFYYYDKGEMDFGWDKIKGEWYYFYPETGILATNTKVLNYDVDENGKMIKIHEW